MFGSLVLPAGWRTEIKRRVADYNRVHSVEEERAVLSERLRRLTTAYTLGNVDDEAYKQQQFEQIWVENPRVLLPRPEEVKRRLAEQQAAVVVMVETGENRTPRPARFRPKYPTRVGDALV